MTPFTQFRQLLSSHQKQAQIAGNIKSQTPSPEKKSNEENGKTDRNVNFEKKKKMAGTEKWLLRKKEQVTSLPYWALDAAKSYSVTHSGPFTQPLLNSVDLSLFRLDPRQSLSVSTPSCA